MLIRALSAIKPKEFENLATAIQIEIEITPSLSDAEVGIDVPMPVDEVDVDVPAPAEFDVDVSIPAVEETIEQTTTTSAPNVEVEVEPVAQSTLTIQSESAVTIGFSYPEDSLRDGNYESEAPGVVNEIIRALRSHNWYIQNPAIRLLKDNSQETFEPGQWFVIGRNIYQAACGNAQKALEFLKNLDIEFASFPKGTANHILSGMLYEVYFGRDGNFRTTPKAAHIDQIMRTVAEAQYEQSKNTLLAQLASYTQLVPFKPGDIAPLMLDIEILEVDAAETGGAEKELIVQSVKFLGEERLQDSANRGAEIDNWSNFAGPTKTTANRIKSELSDNYAIPGWGIQSRLNSSEYMRNEFTILEGKTLVLERPSLSL